MNQRPKNLEITPGRLVEIVRTRLNQWQKGGKPYPGIVHHDLATVTMMLAQALRANESLAQIGMSLISMMQESKPWLEDYARSRAMVNPELAEKVIQFLRKAGAVLAAVSGRSPKGGDAAGRGSNGQAQEGVEGRQVGGEAEGQPEEEAPEGPAGGDPGLA